jgi:hypothetical protein
MLLALLHRAAGFSALKGSLWEPECSAQTGRPNMEQSVGWLEAIACLMANDIPKFPGRAVLMNVDESRKSELLTATQ